MSLPFVSGNDKLGTLLGDFHIRLLQRLSLAARRNRSHQP
jgi:hypothetical protein